MSFRFFFFRRRPQVILQNEAAECGLACLAMIVNYHSKDGGTNLRTMRERFPTSLRGATLKSLIEVARQLRMQVRPLRLEMVNLEELAVPCVLHWDLNHFVVLECVTGSHATILDPTIGRRVLRLEEVGHHFTGVALELSPRPDFLGADTTERVKLRSLIGNVPGLRLGLVKILCLGLVLQACVLAAPYYLQLAIDRSTSIAEGERTLTALALAFLGLAFIQAAIGLARSWAVTTLATTVNFQWLINGFAQLFRLPLSFFELRHVGDIVSRFGSIQKIQALVTSQFVEALIDGLLVVGTLGVMLSYSVALTIVPLLASVSYLIIRWSVYPATRRATAEQLLHAGRQHTHFLESARGVQTIRLFAKEDERMAGWANALAQEFDSQLRVARINAAQTSLTTLVGGTGRVAVVWFGASLVLNGSLSIGMLFAFLSYQEGFLQRSSALVDKAFEGLMLRLHLDRLADIVLTTPEEGGNEGEPSSVSIHTDASPSIRLEGVYFRYSEQDPFVLNDINLEVRSGDLLALTGPSGCGKTTLAKVMLGLLSPTSGRILIGDVELNTMGRRRWRAMIGAVMQEDRLFTGSINQNVSFFDPHIDHKRIAHVLRLAKIDRDIASMPMGGETLVTDNGVGLSGGQKQRLLIARALYREPKVLILDEATSNLDAARETGINEAIRDLALTRIVIAHRKETLESTTRVVRMTEGRIVEDTRTTVV